MELPHPLTGLCLGLLFVLAPPAFPGQAENAAPQVRAIVEQARHPLLKRPDFRPHDGEMRRFYEPLGYQPAWFRDGRPRREVPEILAVLGAAGDEGLDPTDYGAIWLNGRWGAAAGGKALDPAALAEFDTALSLGLFRYLSDVRFGRIKPLDVGFEFDVEREKPDLALLLRDALQRGTLPELLAQAEPKYPLYRRLKETLKRYRALTVQPLPVPQPPPATRKVEPGQPYAGAEELRRLLTAYGDLAPGAATGTAGIYDATLAEAVRGFQNRHGLAPDGVLGKATFAALNVPPAQRVRQIELALERMRWLPDLPQGPVIAINIPEFKLRAFDEEAGRLRLQFRSDIVVGKALNTRTPVFADQLEYVVFSPFWNVPPSIARNEIIPEIRKDPDYLLKHNMELVRSATAGPVEAALGDDTLEAIRRGELRVRQRPGEKNALGSVKFVFPNNMNIYLHDTPARSLFKRARRDFSHGCIRVSDPMGLARFVLRGIPEWSDEAIEAAMRTGKEQYVRLKRGIPVVIFYTTVIVEEGGLVRFLPDIYGLDQELDLALKARDGSAL
ncbi:MAG TPA: L,D-transpeptidase family protein [Burkholderiales bacterium]